MAARDIERLLRNDGIIRSRAKIEAAIKRGAKLWLEIEEKSRGGFQGLIWKHVGGKPQVNQFKNRDKVPAQTAMSEALSKDLKKRGFNFCGPVISYAFAQATGMVNDHLTTCFRHEECARLGQKSPARTSDPKKLAALRSNGTMNPVIMWFRHDLRLGDNPALRMAAASGAPVLPLFVLDDETPGAWKWGGASRWWLHHSLGALDKSLKGHLVLRRGNALEIVTALAREVSATAVVWNRCYEPFAVARDTQLKADLADAGIKAESFNGSLLHEPWALKTGSGTPFRVFTPFWKAMRPLAVDQPHPAPRNLRFHKAGSDALESWKLLPRHPDWAQGFDWTARVKRRRVGRCMISRTMCRTMRWPRVTCPPGTAPRGCHRTPALGRDFTAPGLACACKCTVTASAMRPS